MNKIREILEKFQEVEWILALDKVETGGKIRKRLDKAEAEIAEIMKEKDKNIKYWQEQSANFERTMKKRGKEISRINDINHDWQYTLAYFTKEDVATPEGVREFIMKGLEENCKEIVRLKEELRMLKK